MPSTAAGWARMLVPLTLGTVAAMGGAVMMMASPPRALVGAPAMLGTRPIADADLLGVLVPTSTGAAIRGPDGAATGEVLDVPFPLAVGAWREGGALIALDCAYLVRHGGHASRRELLAALEPESKQAWAHEVGWVRRDALRWLRAEDVARFDPATVALALRARCGPDAGLMLSTSDGVLRTTTHPGDYVRHQWARLGSEPSPIGELLVHPMSLLVLWLPIFAAVGAVIGRVLVGLWPAGETPADDRPRPV